MDSYKWYRLAVDAINDTSLIPARSDTEILSFISEADWLMFSPLSSIDEAKNSSLPNIYFNLIEDENKGEIGLSFNTVKAVDRLKNILSEYSGTEKRMLLDELLKLDGVWEIRVSRKIKDRIFSQKPKWKVEFSKKTNQIDDAIIDELVETSNTIREEGREKRESIKLKTGKFYLETPEVSLMVCDFDLSDENFIQRMREASKVLSICLSIKTDSQIRKLQKTTKVEQKTTDIIKCPNCGITIRAIIENDNEASCGVCKGKILLSDLFIEKL